MSGGKRGDRNRLHRYGRDRGRKGRVNKKDVAPYGATFEDGYRNAVVCDAIVESAESGRQVLIKY